MRGGRGGGFGGRGRRPIYRGHRPFVRRPLFWGIGRFMWFPWFFGLAGFIFLLIILSAILR